MMHHPILRQNGILTLCMLGNFACFFVVCRFFFFFFSNYIFFLKKKFQEYHSVNNNLGPDLARHFVEPDLDPNCLQRLSADDKSRHSRGKS